MLSEIRQWPVDQIAAAAVLPDGTTVFEGVIDTAFELASLTKPLVAVATLVAVEDETLDLDQAAGPNGSTLRHLLAHASGLDAESDQVLAPPGARRIYSNTGFELVRALVESTTGLTLAGYVDEAVLQPLAMGSTVIGASGATGAIGTVSDLARFAVDLLAPSPLTLASETRNEATQVSFPGLVGVLPGFGRQDPNDWGLGFEVRGTKVPHWTPPDASPATFGHFGRSGSLMWVDPVHRCGLVVLGNRPFGDWAIPLWQQLGTTVITLCA